jgi:chaperonin cofactor prefoldin
MEQLQKQLLELSQQVRNLSKTVEELPQQLLKGTSDLSIPTGNYFQPIDSDRWEHKDILTDRGQPHWHHQLDEKEISSEWQVRRLTAQLTMAYNRIAELEEELLNRRIASR